MSTSTPYNLEGGKSKGVFQVSPSAGGAHIFNTSSSPHNFEARRSSMTSPQSSTSSFPSFMSNYSTSNYSTSNYSTSNYSMPTTPISSQSPLNEDVFLDVIGYDLGQNVNIQHFHDPPTALGPKMTQTQHNFAEPCLLMPHRVKQVQSNGLVSPAGESHRIGVPGQSGLNGVMDPQSEVSWDTMPTTVHVDGGRPWDGSFLQPIVPQDSEDAFWTVQMQQTQRLQAPAIVPSEAILDVEEDYVLVNSNAMVDINSMGNMQMHSPHGVWYNRESLSSMNQETDIKDDTLRLRRSRYLPAVSPTGEEIVMKKEGGSKAGLKARPKTLKITKSQRVQRIPLSDGGINPKEHGCIWSWDEDKQKHRWYAPQRSAKLPCGNKGCPKVFARPEHRVRHMRTHLPPDQKQLIGCGICDRKFDKARWDNFAAHHITHIRKPDKKAGRGRNNRFTLRYVLSHCTDSKVIDKLKDWASKHPGEFNDGDRHPEEFATE